ncbi:hypothetical protein Q1695_004711 [Nippostrongylus brasiliensis]|nr:hypothetical protein Q1695_004711 [Nippostrongylus brasiliensis]
MSQKSAILLLLPSCHSQPLKTTSLPNPTFPLLYSSDHTVSFLDVFGTEPRWTTQRPIHTFKSENHSKCKFSLGKSQRVLRPAKLIYNGGDVVTHQWVGSAGQYGTNAFQYQQKGRAYGEEHEYESRIPPEPRQYDVPGHN